MPSPARPVLLAIAAVAFATAPLLATPPDRLEDPPSDAYLPPDPARPRTTPAAASFGGATAVQVNVDDDGNNITGDAGNEPSITVDPTAPNRLAIGWRQFDNIDSSFRQAGVAWSNDGGRTWTFPGVLDPGVFRSDPVLDSDTEGTLYYYSLRGNFLCDMYLSNDGGVSWSGPFEAFGGDKAWFALDKNQGSPNQGDIYVSWSTAAGCCGSDIFTKSIDGGLNYCLPSSVPLSPVWGTVVFAPDGAGYVVGTGGGAHKIARTAVDFVDGQFEFSANINLGGDTQAFQGNDSPNPGGLMGQVWVAVDRSNGPNAGDIFVLGSVNPPGPDPMNVNFIRSPDRGETWTDPVQVNNPLAPGWSWFGTMSVAPNGRIDAVFLDTRLGNNDPAISALYYSFSDDGGATWSADEQLSPTFDSHVGWPQQNKMGDYIDMVSDDVGAHLAWAATFNGEQDVYYTRIGDYDCNSNGVGDTIDLEMGDSLDCNDNDIPDECEIAAGVLPDDNDNGIPDDCELDADVNGDGVVDVLDLVEVITNWGPCPPGPCDADIDGDGVVSVTDLTAVILGWD
jgi:hypothetical protein